MNGKIKTYPLGQLFNKPFKKTDFAILNSEDILNLISNDSNINGVSQYHKHDFYTIFWVEKGQLSQKLDSKSFLLKKNDVFIICPGQVHENNFNHSSKEVIGGAILFTTELISQLKQNNEISELTFLDNIFSNPHLHFSRKDFENLLSIINLLFKNENKPKSNLAIVKSLFSALLLSIQQAIDESIIKVTSNRHTEVYKQFKHYLELYYKDHKTLGFYSGLLHIGERHLNRLLRETTSKTASEMIRGRAVLEAKRLLAFTDLNISEIAENLGYLDNSNFTKVFKKETGQTPQSYRLSMS